jgi:hypothetical protein
MRARIQQRLLTSFDCVELHPKNAMSFSYEYSSLLRDIGSVFSSFLDSIVKLSKFRRGKLNINDYCAFLIKEVDGIEEICVEINAEYVRAYRG